MHGVNLHDLLPIPYTEEALNHVVDRFHDGHAVNPIDYQRILNSLCKTLLQLEYADAA